MHKKRLKKILKSLVPKTGIEPVRCFGAEDRNRTGTVFNHRRILSPVRLPVPPLRHTDGSGNRT